jgi:DNA-binding IclR family transcriptional regulator
METHMTRPFRMVVWSVFAGEPAIGLIAADHVGITLGSAQRILADLVDGGYVNRERHGRRNRYVINLDTPMLRHTAQDGYDIGGLLDLLRLQNED